MTTIDTGLALEIEMLSPAEATQIWKRQTKRAPNFAEYQMFMDTHDIGASWRTRVPAGDHNADNAKEIRRNFNEAAKERTVWVEYADAAPTDALETTVDTNGKKHARVPRPVMIRWKTNSHVEQRTVTKDNKKATIDVTVIDSLAATIVATEAIQRRGPRAVTEDVTASAVKAGAPADAKKGAKFVLPAPDNRTALRTAAGKWRAPKPAAQAA